MSNDLLTRANEILADCNQTPSAREVIAELVEALRVEPDADVAELITTGREYVRQVAGQAAYLWSNQMTVLCDALEREHRARRVAEGENARLVVALEWEVELKRALMPYQLRAITAEERITTLQAALNRLLRQAEMTDDYLESTDGTLRSSCEQARKALAILTPTPNVQENTPVAQETVCGTCHGTGRLYPTTDDYWTTCYNCGGKALADLQEAK